MHQPIDTQSYVLCFAAPTDVPCAEVLLIEKLKPEWQAGKFNLPGGKIEEGETIHEAAARELKEETTIECSDVRVLGVVHGSWGECYVCMCSFDSSKNRTVHVESERPFWMPVDEALNHDNLIDNLRFIIPWCFCELVGWSLYQGPMHSPNQFAIQFEDEIEKA